MRAGLSLHVVAFALCLPDLEAQESAAGEEVAKDPPAAAVPFVAGDHDLEVVVDARALRDAGLLAANSHSRLVPWLAAVGQGSGLDAAELHRAVLVREAGEAAGADRPGAVLLVLVGTEALRLPAASAAMPETVVAGRPARALSVPFATGPVLVQVEPGLLVAGTRAVVASRLEGGAARGQGAESARALAPGELVRVRVPLARDAAMAIAPPSARRNASHAEAEAEFSLRWVRTQGEHFVLAGTVRGFAVDHEAARCAAAFAATASALAGEAAAKPLHAVLARTQIALRGREVTVEVELGEAPEAVAVAEALARFAGLPLPAAR